MIADFVGLLMVPRKVESLTSSSFARRQASEVKKIVTDSRGNDGLGDFFKMYLKLFHCLLFCVGQHHSPVKKEVSSHQVFGETGKSEQKEVGYFHGGHHFLYS